MKKLRNRYVILFAAAIVNFSYGSAYIWSVFQPAAKEKFQLEAGSANRPFNIFMGLFVLGNILGGKLQLKFGTRKTVLTGSFLMCLGFLLTAFVPSNLPSLLSITYGMMGGTGAGIAYNALIAGTQKWFPDKRGMVTGIIICTVGAPGLIMTPILNACIAQYGFSTSMKIVALIYTVICFGLGWIVVSPSEEYMKSFHPTNVSVDNTIPNLPRYKQYTTREILRTKQFYLISGAMMLAVPAYFLMNPMMKSLGLDRGLTESLAITGIMISSVLNICGRLIAPWTSDKLGRKTMLIILFVISMTSVLTLISATGYLFLICVSMISFSYGGFFGIFPVIVVDYFGAQYSGMNYGVVMIGYGIVSILCPTIVSMGVGISFVVAGVACILGMICTIALRKPGKI